MENEALDTILSPGFIILFFLAAGIGTLIPAILTKLVMRGAFGHETSFGMILLMMVISAFLAVLALAYLNVLDEESFALLPTGLKAALIAAGYAVQLALLSAFAPDENMDSIPMWKWAVALILQYILFVAITFVVVFFIGLAASAAPLPRMG